MPWLWPSQNPRELARYATPLAGCFLDVFPHSTFNQRQSDPANWARNIAKELYNALLQERIQYDYEPFRPGSPHAQEIRQPQEILGKVGTCLDLALLFSGLCLYKNLIPILLVFEEEDCGHALVAISLEYELCQYEDSRRFLQPALSKNDPAAPLFNNQDSLREAVDPKMGGNYLAIECTGFALSANSSTQAEPSGAGTLGFSTLSFDEAVAAGLERVRTGKLRYAIDLAIEQESQPTFSGASLDSTVLGHATWVKRRWTDWASQQNAWSPTFGSVYLDDRVQSPLNTIWRSFLQKPAWHVTTKDAVESVCAQLATLANTTPELANFQLKLSKIPWTANYEAICEKLLPIVAPLKSCLGRLVDKMEQQIGQESEYDRLKNCQRITKTLFPQLQEPHFNRAFLIAASDGNGKTFLVDSILRNAEQKTADTWILIRIRQQDSRNGLETAILRELEKVLQIPMPGHLETVDKFFERANIRLIISLEDLQNHLHDRPGFLNELIEFVKDHTSLRSLFWLFTLNDTSYDRVAARYADWTKYGFKATSEEEIQHSGWLRLDDLNRQNRIGIKIMETYLADGIDLGTQFRDISDFSEQHLYSPLIASIVLELSARSPGRSILALNFIELIDEFWARRLESADIVSHQPVKDAITVLARMAAKEGKFELAKPKVEAALRKASSEVADLTCLQKLSLLRLEVPEKSTSDDSETINVHLLFELFWAHHLATALSKFLAAQKLKPSELAEIAVERFKPLDKLELREAIAQQLLLLIDTWPRKNPKQEKHAAHLWSHFRTSTELPRAAVYFAALKSSAERQQQILGELSKDKGELQSAREIFAVMHLLAESSEPNLQNCLTQLRYRAASQGIAFKGIADAGLGDYFWFLIKRQIRSVGSLADCIACWRLLANCHIMGVAAKVAYLMRSNFFEPPRGDSQHIQESIEQYLIADATGARQEQENPYDQKPKGGEPYYFREHLLRHGFDCLLNDQGIALMTALEKRHWFKRTSSAVTGKQDRRSRERKSSSRADDPIFDLRIVHQVRKHWSQSCGNWYRRKGCRDPDDRDLFYAMIEKRIDSDEKDHFELAYFMVRHTVKIGPDRTAFVDMLFKEPFMRNERKLYDLQRDFPIKFGHG